MNTREQLNQYLRGVETRLRWLVVSKGAAIAAGVALGATIALVLFTNALAFSSESMAWARFLLFVALAMAVGFGLVLPIVRLNQRKAAKRAEVIFPDFQQRLLTFVEKREQRGPMFDLLTDDTALIANRTQLGSVARTGSIFTFATTAGAAAAVLIWLIVAGPGYLGYWSSVLLGGAPPTGAGGPQHNLGATGQSPVGALWWSSSTTETRSTSKAVGPRSPLKFRSTRTACTTCRRSSRDRACAFPRIISSRRAWIIRPRCTS